MRSKNVVLWIRAIRCATQTEAAALAAQLRREHPGDHISVVPEPSPPPLHEHPAHPQPLRPHRRPEE